MEEPLSIHYLGMAELMCLFTLEQPPIPWSQMLFSEIHQQQSSKAPTFASQRAWLFFRVQGQKYQPGVSVLGSLIWGHQEADTGGADEGDGPRAQVSSAATLVVGGDAVEGMGVQAG